MPPCTPQAAPNNTSPHYSLVKQGLMFSSGAAADLLFHTRDCLCLDQTQCMNSTDVLYEVRGCTRAGHPSPPEP